MILNDKAIEMAFESLALKSKNARYRDDPVRWAEDVLEVELWSKQREILESLVHNKKTAVKSCHAIGKTFISAVAVCWWVATRQDAMVRSTAPTSYQVHELLWEEIRKMHSKAGLEGEVNQKDEWKKSVHGAISIVGSGKKPSDTNIHSFHGVHRPEGVLTIIDEGCGVPQSLFTAADAISTGRHDRVLTVGNPDDPNTPYGEIFLHVTPENEAIWNRITVSAFDTPNFTGEHVPDVVRENLIQPDWVDARAREWGIDSGRYKSKILGEFPDQSDNSFFSQRTIDNAFDTNLQPDLEDAEAVATHNARPLVLGVDIAGGGADDTVIYGNRGGVVRKITSWSEGNALFLAQRIIDVAAEQKADEIRIDNGGFGKAVIDIMLEDPRIVNFRVIRMMGGDQPTDISAHRNKRAENYDHLRIEMDAGRIDLDREDTKVRDQLLAVQYQYTERGSIKLEAKADIRKRGGKSPDELDAIVYCTADLTYLFTRVDSDVKHIDPRDYFSDIPQWALVSW